MHILITGAADGIGYALAEHFSREENAKLTLVDINLKGLQEAKQKLSEYCQINLIDADLSQPINVDHVVTEAEKFSEPIDILINNAGIMKVQNFSTIPWQKGEVMINLNFVTPLKLANKVLPNMIKNKAGTIINIASIAAVTPLPGCTYYSSTKAGLALASEIMHDELKAQGIHVVTVYPGPVDTALEKGARADYKSSFISNLLPTGDRDKIASKIFRAYKKREARLVYPHEYDIFRNIPGLTYLLAKFISPKPIM